jgi:hypothetical protein
MHLKTEMPFQKNRWMVMDGKCTGTSTPTELRESQDSMTRDAHLDGYFVGKSLTKSKDLNTCTGGQ